MGFARIRVRGGTRCRVDAAAPGCGDAGTLDGDGVPPLEETRPAKALPRPATPIEPRRRPGRGPVKEMLEGVGVAMDSIVARRSSQPRIETGAEGFAGPVPIRRHPFLEPLARPLPPLARGAALDARHAVAVCFPVNFDAPNGAPPRQARMEATAAQHAGLRRCDLSCELPHSPRERLGDPFRQCDLDSLIRKMPSEARHLIFVYKTGPCGYGLYRSLTKKATTAG